jgi:hypothetical protein
VQPYREPIGSRSSAEEQALVQRLYRLKRGDRLVRAVGGAIVFLVVLGVMPLVFFLVAQVASGAWRWLTVVI